MNMRTSPYLIMAFLAFVAGCQVIPSPTAMPLTLSPVQPTQTATAPAQSPTPAPPSPEPPPTATLTSVPPGETIVVSSTADSGPGSLRQALQDAQNGDTILFDPTVFPPDAPETIAVTSGLPQLGQGNLTIDASDAGVILDGSQLSRDTWIPGLEIVSDGNTIRGLQVINFTGTGIVVAFHGRNNTIGGDRNIGMGPIGQGNLSSGNSDGIGLWDFASSNLVTGNLVGTDISGTEPMGNPGFGVGISEGAIQNMIGPDNILAFNRCGVLIEGFDSLGNTATQNGIFDNDEAGICLVGGGNVELLAPFLFDFDLTAGLISGTACASCTIEIFSDNGNEGAFYEGQTIADGRGIFIFNKGASFIGPHLTADATDLDGNTSEFSKPTSGTIRSLVLQQGNDLPKAVLQLKESRELADNRIGSMYYSPDTPGPPNLDFPVEEFIASGIKRLDTSLTENEPPIDWSFSETDIPLEYDQFVDALIENGIAVNYIILFWDKADHPGGEGLTRPRFKTDEQVQDFLDYVRFVVSHFKGRVEYYTIWSEPDYCGHDGLKCILPEDYIDLVRQVIPVIREGDPQAKVVSAPYVLFFGREQLFTVLRSDVVQLFDVISWHPYYDVVPNSKLYGNYYYEYPSIIREIQQTASAHGFEGEYWGTEIGWCSEDLPWCTAPAYEREILETDLLAAKYYARGIVMELGLDVGVGLDVHDTGLPWSYPTMRNLNTVMAGNEPIELAVEFESDATNIMSFGFSLPDGDKLFALWTNGAAVDDDPGVSATLTFPGSSAQQVVGIDVLNGFEQELITEAENGDLVIRNLLVKDYPIILRLTE